MDKNQSNLLCEDKHKIEIFEFELVKFLTVNNSFSLTESLVELCQGLMDIINET